MYSIKESYHWKEALATGLSLILGIGLIVAGFQNADYVGQVLGGLAIIIVSIVAIRITDGWKHANNLPIGKKIVAYLPVVITGIGLLVLLLLLYALKEAFKESFE